MLVLRAVHISANFVEVELEHSIIFGASLLVGYHVFRGQVLCRRGRYVMDVSGMSLGFLCGLTCRKLSFGCFLWSLAMIVRNICWNSVFLLVASCSLRLRGLLVGVGNAIIYAVPVESSSAASVLVSISEWSEIVFRDQYLHIISVADSSWMVISALCPTAAATTIGALESEDEWATAGGGIAAVMILLVLGSWAAARCCRRWAVHVIELITQ